MIFFLHGSDTYRSHQKLNELKNKFIKDIDQTAQSLVVIDGKKSNIKELNEKISSGSLFVKRRMVIIENILENKSETFLDEVEEMFNKKGKKNITEDEENIIIFYDTNISEKDVKLKKNAKKLANFLLKEKYVQEFKSLTPLQLIDYIKEMAQKEQININNEAVKLLISRTNSDLWRISSELHKLSMMLNDQESINEQLVKDNVSGFVDENIFALTDAIANVNKKLSARLLEEQYLAGLSEDYILAMLIRQFKILLQIKSAYQNNLSVKEIANDLKIHPYVIKKSLSQINNFSLNKLKNKLNQLVLLDFKNKTGQSNLKAELDLFVYDI